MIPDLLTAAVISAVFMKLVRHVRPCSVIRVMLRFSGNHLVFS